MSKRTRPASPSMTEDVAEKAVRSLHRALRNCGRADLVSSLLLVVERKYIYVGDAQGGPLCRLRYTGNPDDWTLQMFKWSSERYDMGNDFGFAGGTMEECMRAMLSGYRI